MQEPCEEKQMRISIQRTRLVLAPLIDEISILLQDTHNLEASVRLQNKLKLFIPELIDPQKNKRSTSLADCQAILERLS